MLCKILYQEIDGKIEFRRVEPWCLTLSESALPPLLRKPIDRQPLLTVDEQAFRLVAASGWYGGRPINAKSPAGVAIKGRRTWYPPEDDPQNAK